jgi:hypothetical protein
MRAARPARLPYHLLTVLLYGRFDWITRHGDGSITVPTGPVSRELQTRSEDLRDALVRLRDLGLLPLMHYHGTYFVAKPVPPPGYGLLVGPNEPLEAERVV